MRRWMLGKGSTPNEGADSARHMIKEQIKAFFEQIKTPGQLYIVFTVIAVCAVIAVMVTIFLFWLGYMLLTG
jgi:hypothetical protein